MADNEASPAVNVTVVGLTDVGRVREHNEDNFLVMNAADGKSLANGERAEWVVDKAAILAVADGMGGAAAGEVASQHAVDRFGADLRAVDYRDATPDQLIARIDQTLQAANDDILKDVEQNPDRKGMGTTMTSAVVVGGTAYISQVGDSRCYLLRKGKLLRLTRDQSLIEQLIDEGTITPEEAEKMGGHNIILQALGVEETVRPDTKQFPVLRGDVLLFCSDGLSGMIKDDVIEQIMVDCGHDLVEGVQNLIQAANDNGGRDNITVVLARFDGEGLREPMAAIAQGDIEQTGVRFQAPPPPEVPNPMKKLSIVGLAILAVLAIMLFVAGRSDADLQLTLEPSDLEMALVLVDAQGQERASLSAVRGEAEIPKIELGTYTLKATAADYWDFETELKITEAAVNKQSVRLTPKPVALFEVTCKHSHVSVVLTPAGSSDPLTGTVMSDKPLQLRDVPAGSVELTATRDGFTTFTRTLDLPPGSEKESLEIDLVERNGTLVVRPADGARVTVVDSRGDPIGSGTTTASGDLRLTVRIGTQHEVRAVRDGFEPFSTRVDVAEGQDTVVELQFERVRTTVRFRSSVDLDGQVERQAGAGWESLDGRSGRVMGLAGALSRPVRLEPGHYRITWEQDGRKRTKTFDVTAPRDGATLEVGLDG